MHGGTLQPSSLIAIEQHDLLIAVFSNHFYFFSLAQGTLLTKVVSHDAPILHIHYAPTTQIVTSVDSSGIVVENRLGKEGTFQQKGKHHTGFGGQLLKQATTIINRNGELQIYGLTTNQELLKHSQRLTGSVANNCSKILYLDQYRLIVRSEDYRLLVIDPVSLQVSFVFEHTCEVTTVGIYQSSLIVGDVRGKVNILRGFLQSGEVQMRQKLQWHVHEITSLKVEDAYLYTAGEEGVIVMWHLRENKRDFLPRIGAKIANFIVKQSKIYCMLADNTIKMIDTAEDKKVVHYKVVVGNCMDSISHLSSEKVKDSLVRVSGLHDKIFLRSMPGRIQQINLGNGLNTEHMLVARNLISRLDSHLPSPHQVTDLCLSGDSSRMTASVEGLNCRSLRFYQTEGDSYRLVSKVQNVHRGLEPIRILSFGQKVVSYSESDPVMKIWGLMRRKKQSILQVQEHFWGCEYEISFRSKLPLHVSVQGSRLTASYQHQFVVFNTEARTIENVYQTEGDKDIIATFALTSDNKHNKHAFLVVFATSLQVLEYSKQTRTATTILKLNLGESYFHKNNIRYNEKSQASILLVEEAGQQTVYVYKHGDSLQQYEVEKSQQASITDVFWLGERVMVLDSQHTFYDISHGREIVSLVGREGSRTDVDQEMGQSWGGQTADYGMLYNRYLERQYRRDQASLQQSKDVIAVAPSLTSSFDYLAKHLFL